MKHIKAPDNIRDKHIIKVFLAGSIEMGAAENWQERVAKSLEGLDIVVYNPRRDDWDSSWSQDPETSEQFIEQVNWELNRIKESDLVIFYFDPATKSPVTLMELGLCLGMGKDVIVYCPRDFYRFGNVYLTMKNAGVLHDLFDDSMVYNNEGSFLEYARSIITSMNIEKFLSKVYPNVVPKFRRV